VADLEPIPYSDAKIRAILERVKTIAIVGASPGSNLWLQACGSF
jgi:predicted CoA-binding protein